VTTQKELKSENLPFEKIRNRFCKYLLGVHKKSSNFASRYELGRLPILIFITLLTYKYYSRLEKLPSTRLVKEAFDVGRGLYLEGIQSWWSFIYKSTENMKIDISKLSTDDISKIVNNYYKKSVEDQLKIFKNQTTDSKLNTFANCYNEFSLKSCLDLNLSKSIVNKFTKLRISAHTLLIEKGR
jgi:hypothetical protein